MSKKIFINFSGSIGKIDYDLVNRQKLLNISANKFANIDETIAWTREDLIDSDFYKNNQSILNSPRGAGYWAWKPYIILQTLKKSAPNDWVIYCDVGKPFRRGDPLRSGNNAIGNAIYTPVDAMIAYAKLNSGFTPGVWIPHYGLAHVWTKRDCFVAMGCDEEKYHQSPHVQAGYSAWSNSKESINFLEEWLRWCCDEKVISDNKNILGKPNSDKFRDHRHDQAIMSNLVVKKGIKPYGPKKKSLNGYRNINLILRHMMLSSSHQTLKQQFSELFKGQEQELPTFLQEIINLLFLTEIKKPGQLKILIQPDHNALAWQTCLPDALIDILQINNNDQKLKEYDGVFITRANQQYLNKQFLGTLYQSIKPGGTLIVGPYAANKEDQPKQDGTFSELITWIEKNQRLPNNCGSLADQKQNALTSGSTVNPLIIRLNESKSCYATFVKPKIYLIKHLT